MKTNRMYIALVALTLAAGTAGAQDKAAPADKAADKAAPADGPRIQFTSETVDLGDVVKGEPATFEFTFKNGGTKDLEIEQAKPSCGCTVADFTRTLKPGESGKVTARIDTKRFKGPITKTVTVTSNDTTNPTIHLQAKAVVKALVDVSPSDQVYFRVFPGDEVPTKRVVTITADKDNPFEVQKVESTNPAITTKLIPVAKEGDALGGNYQLEIDVVKDAPLGALTGILTVTTTHPKVPTLTLNVNGQVLGDVIVTPQKVYLGQVTPSTASSVKRTVRVERRKGNDFKIEKIESTNPAVKAEIQPVEDGKVYTVTISMSESLAVGAINANIVIKTNDKDQPSIEIPVIGTVRG